MAEEQQLFFSHQELLEALVVKQGLHEGIWQLAVQFGLGASNIQNPQTNEVAPAAIVPIIKIGLRRTNELGPLCIDAAKANPGMPTEDA